MSADRGAAAEVCHDSPSTCRSATSPYIAVVVSLVLCSLSLLVPIERGFPTVKVAGFPFRWPFVVSAAVIAILLVCDARQTIRTFSTRYCLRHACVVGVLLVGALRAELWVTAIGRIVAYLTAYVLNYVVLAWLFRRGGRKAFLVVLCCVAALAAALGIAEGILAYRPSIYGKWFVDYDWALGEFEVGRGAAYRINGTLGNPIVYAMAMILCIPFAAEIRNTVTRLALISLLLGAAAFTISKVAVLAVLPLFGFLLWRLVARHGKVCIGALATLLLVYQFVPGFSNALSGNDLITRWTVRLKDPKSAATSIGLRTGMASGVISGLSDPVAFIMGHGMLSESDVSTLVYADLGTVDNTYLNFLYESGVLGLMVYLWAFVTPLWDLRRTASRLHYWGAVSLLLASVAFVSYHYYTFNFVATASIATLYPCVRERQQTADPVPA